MSLGEITDEIREAYKWLQSSKFKCDGVLHNALRDQLAAKLKAEFWAEHGEMFDRPDGLGYCLECGGTEMDPRHNRTDENWQAEADRLLIGKEAKK